MSTISSMPSYVYTAVFLVSFCSWVLFEVWVFSRDRGRSSKAARSGGLGVILSLAIAITIALNLPGTAPMFNVTQYFVPLFVTGIALIWIGILFRAWAIRTLGKFFSTQLVIQEHHQLITGGPYKYLRNPSYTAALITFTGFGLALGNWLSLAVLLVGGLVAYAQRIRVEDRMMSEQFGEAYEVYKHRSWALIPFVW